MAASEKENPEDEVLRAENHHLRQNRGRIERFALGELKRTLEDGACRRPYYVRRNELRTTNHWGQRKLFLSEIEFLTLFGHLSDTLLYVGAAPGPHIEALADLFPRHKFVLYDPASFTCRATDRIEIHQEFFTDEKAKEFAGKDVLYVCDIRTADPGALEEEEVEDAVEADQKMQMVWHVIMRPARSMLKFRLPWGKGHTTYLDGEVFLPVWGRQSTTETRLVCRPDCGVRKYDNEKYEQQMFYFNTVTRVSCFEHVVQDVAKVPGLCHCYDCAAEVHILSEYLVAENGCDKARISDEVSRLSLRLNDSCSPRSHRTLSTVIGHGQKWFAAKRYDIGRGRIYRVRERHNEVDSVGTRRPRGEDFSYILKEHASKRRKMDSPEEGEQQCGWKQLAPKEWAEWTQGWSERKGRAFLCQPSGKSVWEPPDLEGSSWKMEKNSEGKFELAMVSDGTTRLAVPE